MLRLLSYCLLFCDYLRASMFHLPFPDAGETRPFPAGVHAFLHYPQGFAINSVLHIFTDLLFFFSHNLVMSKSTHLVRSERATAILRPGAFLHEAAGGLSDNNPECDPTIIYPVLLTITKIRKKREDRGVVVRKPAPLARVHAASLAGCGAVHPDPAFFLE